MLRRSDASASSSFLDLDATYKFSNDFKVKGLFSTTRGVGTTDQDRGLTYARYGTGVTFQLQGVNEAPTWSYQNAGPGTSPVASNYTLIATNAPNRYKTVDREQSLALDAEYQQNSGIFQSIEFGARHADHHRDHRRSQLKLKSSAITPPDPSLALAYPGDFGDALGSGFDKTGFYFSRDFLRQYFADKYKATTPEFERLVASEIELRERQSALYFQQNLETADGKLSGNVGLRYARTIVDAQIATLVERLERLGDTALVDLEHQVLARGDDGLDRLRGVLDRGGGVLLALCRTILRLRCHLPRVCGLADCRSLRARVVPDLP